MAVNVSDIAAMGGVPRYALIALSMKKKEPAGNISRLYQGLNRCAQASGVYIIGGNITASSPSHADEGGFSVCVMLVGETTPYQMVRRNGARVGDILYVTGTLGEAAAGLEILKRSGSPRFSKLINRHKVPTLRIREGRALSTIASAMTDISDGLLSDLTHLIQASGVGAQLVSDHIPISPTLKHYCRETGNDPLPYALNGGEDYELLFTVPEKKINKLEALIAGRVVAACPIGTITSKGLRVQGASGRTVSVTPKGYDHLK